MRLKNYQRVCLMALLILFFRDITVAQRTDDEVTKVTYQKAAVNYIGFGVQSTTLVTSAVSSVNGDDIQQNFNLTLGNTLYGRLPGLTVSQGNSEPGAGTPSFLMRGRNNLGNAASAPLIIVDGFLGGGSGLGSIFSQLVPEEIESISLLKDAAATAVYGSRAANGVLLVTTKKGATGPLKINFSTRQGFSQAGYVPQFLGSADYATLYNEALKNDGLPAKYTQADIDAYRNGSDPYYHPNVNWYTETLRKTAPVSSYNLNFNGGDNSVRYFVMLNALSSGGLYKNFGDQDPESSNSTYNRYNFRTNVDINLSQRLVVDFKLAGSVEQKANPFDYTTASTFNLLASLPPNAFPITNPNGSYGGNALYANPVGNLLKTGFYQSNSRTLQTALRFTEQLDVLAKGLSASAAVSLNNYFIAGSQKSKTYLRSSILPGATPDVTNYTNFGQVSSLTGSEITRDQYRNYAFQASLDYKRTLGQHSLTGLLLFNTDNVTLNGNNTGNGTDAYKHNSLSTRLTYVNSDKYIAEFSGAYMGADNFPTATRYGFFPAGSLGWVVSNENFLRNNKSISFLKLRGSYGLVGNDDIAGQRYAFTQTYPFSGSSGTYWFGTSNAGTNGYAEGVLANPNVTWEKEESANLGLDATFFNRLNVSLDVFNRNRYDILVQPVGTIPQVLGAILPDLNQGKTRSQGFETAIGLNSKPGNALSYFVEANVSYFSNRDVFDAQAAQVNPGLVTAGQLIGQPLRLRAIGFFTPDEVAARAADPKKYPAPLGEIVRAGDIKYQDVGGPNGVPDGIIDENDLVPTNRPGTPSITLGVVGGLRYKGFDLNVVFQAVTGNTAYLAGSYYNAFQNNGQIAPIALGRWTPETAATATYPRLSSKNNLNNYRGSSFWERDASFVKLRSVELGYTLPNTLTNKIRLTNARGVCDGHKPVYARQNPLR